MLPLRFRFVPACVVATFLSSLGCGSAGRGSFDGSIYRDGPIAFRVSPVPNEWRAIGVSHATLAFRDDKKQSTIVLNARCGHLDEDTPLKSLEAHILIGTTEREVIEEALVPMDAREALHAKIHAKLDGVARTLDLFVMKKDGCIYDFLRVSPAGATETRSSEFEEWVGTFHTLPGSGGT